MGNLLMGISEAIFSSGSKVPEWKSVAKNALIALIIFIITFPVFEPDYVIGLDSSYFWAFNYLFNHDFESLKTIVYPYGPLAFLKYGLVIGRNFEYSLLFFFCIKIWCTMGFLFLSDSYGKSKTTSALLLTMIGLLNISIIDYYVIALCFLHAFHYLKTEKPFHIIATVMLSVIALCIKTSIGISCLSLAGATVLISAFRHPQFSSIVKGFLLALLAFAVSVFLIFLDVETAGQFVFNSFRFAGSYSSALSMFPENNWILLSVFLLTLFIPIIVSRQKDVLAAFALFLFPLFACWKHSMSREDFFHSLMLILFVSFFWTIFYILNQKRASLILVAATINVSAYLLNMSGIPDYRPFSLPISGVDFFQKTILNFNAFKADFTERSKKAIEPNRLTPEILTAIGTKTVDAYPFELSYFAANPELNWKPRRTLQSGSFSQWLDKMTAQDFDRENGPDFLIFHYVPDQDNGKFGSIDNRFLLSDNPLAIHNIFNFYSVSRITDKFMLLAKNSQDNFKEPQLSQLYQSEWNTWVPLNQNNLALQRIRLFSSRNFSGSVLGFLFKTEEYFVDYKTINDKEISYRMIPENAQDGLWINPLFREPSDSAFGETVKQVRFRCTKPGFNDPKISYQFETIPYLRNGKISPFTSYFAVQ
jgi:hypothetical protein